MPFIIITLKIKACSVHEMCLGLQSLYFESTCTHSQNVSCLPPDPLLSSGTSFPLPAHRDEARELVSLGFKQKITPRQNQTYCVGFNFFYFLNYHQMNWARKVKVKKTKQNKKQPFNCTQMLPSHPSSYAPHRHTHFFFFFFSQCEFTLITQAASAIGSEETVRGI